MSDRPIEGLMGTTLEKIRQMVDVNTVIGTPITAGNATIIPVSKVVYGFASGGSEFSPKKTGTDGNLFGGGSGAGVTITPIAFISICNDEVKMLSVEHYSDSQDRAVGMVPELIDKIISLFKKDKEEDKIEEKKEVVETTIEETQAE